MPRTISLEDATRLSLHGGLSSLRDATLDLARDGRATHVPVTEFAPQLRRANQEGRRVLAPVADAVGLALKEEVIDEDDAGQHDDALVEINRLVLKLDKVGVGIGAQRLHDTNVRHAAALEGQVLLAVAVIEVPLGRAAGTNAAAGARNVAHVLLIALIVGLNDVQARSEPTSKTGLLHLTNNFAAAEYLNLLLEAGADCGATALERLVHLRLVLLLSG